jgi:hypothetical protein
VPSIPARKSVTLTATLSPIWSVLEFLFYGGVMKAVEEMASPFGDDNQDFNLNFLVERHVKVYLTSDTSYDSLLCSLTQPNNTSNNLTLFFLPSQYT